MQQLATCGVLAYPTLAPCMQALSAAGFHTDHVVLLTNANDACTTNKSTAEHGTADTTARQAPAASHRLSHLLRRIGIPLPMLEYYTRPLPEGQTLIAVVCTNSQQLRVAEDVLAAHQAAVITSTAELRIAIVSL